MIKYSDLQNILKKEYKGIGNELLAYISHYLQNINSDEADLFFEHIPSQIKELLANETIEWDVPFFSKPNPIFTFIDLFAGIGGMRTAFQNLGGKCVFSSEWDEYAQKTYDRNFGEVPFGDITKIDENKIPNHDILVAGFPCQAFSIAGKRGGFEDTRGTLFFNVAKILKAKRPKAFFLENVKGLLNHDRGRTIKVILNTLRNDLNYYVPDPQVINAKDFGVPQNRERVFIVGFRKDLEIDSFEYPRATGIQSCIADIIEEDPVSVKYYLSTQYLKTLIEHKARHESKGNGFGFEIVSLDGIANAIVVGGMGRERNLIIDDRLTDFTPVTKIKGEVNREGIRRITPRECARLQGFSNDFLIKVSDAQAYKQFGNSVAIPAVQATGEVLVNMLYGNLEEMAVEDDNGEQGRMERALRFIEVAG
jgi:DNA (cytosine-5)-methyltransferase 1